MKTVYLLRHAKSSWDEPYDSDHDRPLAPRGRKAAPRMGRFMKKENLLPHRVLCSSARRARETWLLLAEAMEMEIPVEILPIIYGASPNTLLDLVHRLPAQEESVLLVGHNPTFESLALLLTGSGRKEAVEDMERKYPTGALAILDFEVERWEEIREEEGHLRDFIRPKALKKR